MNDYGRYKRQRQSPQVVDVQSTVQPVRNIDETPNRHSDNVVQQMPKDSSSESEKEAWSLDKAINEVFIRPFEKRDILCNGVWRPSVRKLFISG